MSLLTLPGEIIIHIFSTLIEDLGDAPPEPVILHLSSICKSLRELVVSSPILWSRIRLRWFPHDMDHWANLFVARSQDCLLEMSVYFDFVDHLAPEIIRSYGVARWRRLTIHGLSSEIVDFLKAIIDTPTPNLTEVRLFPREQLSCGGDHVPLLSGASDALRTLTMRGCVGCLAPFPHLTKLNISRLFCTYTEFRDLIQGSPNLTTLILGELLDHFEIETFAGPIVSHRPLIEAPSLRIFAVGFTNTDLTLFEDRPLLAFLSMPNLEYLEVVGSRADYGELSGKPFSELTTLCLCDMNFPASDAALYRSFTKITSLELNNVEGIELLAAPEENGAIPWPHLETLRCRFLDSCSWLERLLDRRPQLTLEVPMQRKDDVMAISGSHVVRFFSDEPSGLIRAEDFGRAEFEDEENFSDSDFSDQTDLFQDNDNYDFEYDAMEDEVDDYFDDDDDDDGLEDVVGWF
ncbi:hypothetical protein B0H19DRAFT_1254674 [Mycena capillaripes]|nr:hypothetical protein B0H19DRAFT_1254674 [Mycena capillaripes]